MISALVSLAIVAAGHVGPAALPDITYATPEPGVEMKMDIYLPERQNGEKRPAVIVLHGGAWMSGNRKDMAAIAEGLAKEGFVAATASYRLAPKFKWPAMLDDAQTAVRYLRSNADKYGIDPNNVGSCGASAGGHLALLLGFRDTRDAKPAEFASQSSKVKAVFNIFGPTDMRRDFPATLDPLFQTVLGKPKKDAAEEIRQASPADWVTKDDAPVFTLHGDQDPLVPVAQAKWLKDVLDKAGVANSMTIVPNMKHGIDPADTAQMKGVGEGVEWLKRYLK